MFSHVRKILTQSRHHQHPNPKSLSIGISGAWTYRTNRFDPLSSSFMRYVIPNDGPEPSQKPRTSAWTSFFAQGNSKNQLVKEPPLDVRCGNHPLTHRKRSREGLQTVPARSRSWALTLHGRGFKVPLQTLTPGRGHWSLNALLGT